MKNWNQVKLVPEFNEQGVACYKLAGGNYVNEYYVVSEATGEITAINTIKRISSPSLFHPTRPLGAIVTMPLMVLVFQMVM